MLATLVVVTFGAVLGREGVADWNLLPTPETESALVTTGDGAATPSEGAVPATPAEPLPVPAASPWINVTVKRGQTLSTIFEAQALPVEDWVAVLKLGGDAAMLKRIRAGDVLKLRKDGDRLAELSYAMSEVRTLNIRRVGDRLEAYILAAEIEHRPSYAVGTIESSLFNAGRTAGLSDPLVMQMADIFGYDVDFALDIRHGDRFVVIYEELYKDGARLRDGDILAAEFVNQGQTLRAVRYTDPQGNAAFYSPDGKALRRAFIRTPVDFARISSGFSLARRHPILNVIRAHKGVDYAAASGTPVKATGDGRIVYMGRKSGYGNVIMLRHGASYETVYGHLSRFRSGVRVGSRVQQGQVIAYVGMTGLATAPHLHYEFRVNGIHKNPIRVPLPRANSLPREYLTQFRAITAPLLGQLDNLAHTQYAQAQ